MCGVRMWLEPPIMNWTGLDLQCMALVFFSAESMDCTGQRHEFPLVFPLNQFCQQCIKASNPALSALCQGTILDSNGFNLKDLGKSWQITIIIPFDCLANHYRWNLVRTLSWEFLRIMANHQTNWINHHNPSYTIIITDRKYMKIMFFYL